MNAYDILGITPPSDSVANRGKRTRQSRARKNKQVVTGGETEKEVEKKTEEAPAKTFRDVTLQHVNNNAVVEVYDPVLTRPTLSIYEYSEVHTMLAEYLEDQKSIKNFTNDVEIRANVNPAELAFRLLLEGKWDATLNRGYEIVTYSRLKYNPQWEHTMEHYFNDQHKIQAEELFKPLGLL